jgi:excisionase family DNA binding protein
MVIHLRKQDGQKEQPVTRTRLRPLEFAESVGASKAQVYQWIYTGRLRATQQGRAWFIPITELEEFFEREAA